MRRTRSKTRVETEKLREARLRKAPAAIEEVRSKYRRITRAKRSAELQVIKAAKTANVASVNPKDAEKVSDQEVDSESVEANNAEINREEEMEKEQEEEEQEEEEQEVDEEEEEEKEEQYMEEEESSSSSCRLKATTQAAIESPSVRIPTPEKDTLAGEITAPVKKTKVKRPIAQSSSSASVPLKTQDTTSKRMISFSPEKASPVLQVDSAVWHQMQRNIKYNQKLQERMNAPPALYSPPPMPTHDTRVDGKRPLSSISPALSHSSAVSKTQSLMDEETLAKDEKDGPAKQDEADEEKKEEEEEWKDEVESSQVSEPGTFATKASQEESNSICTSDAFTSTSVIQDVGLFNCSLDAEYTGGVYGEGTDGRVRACVVRGQKVALKCSKSTDTTSTQEAKHRSAVELHYLRRVRNTRGFVQCLGACDAIDHTCIALEVLDCKLSDYLRRYGRPDGDHISRSKRKIVTFSIEETRTILKQICEPLVVLHDDLNVAHGDLACRNILLQMPPKGYEREWAPLMKLSDLGRVQLPSSEPKDVLMGDFSFYKNCDVGSFAREILFRLLVGDVVPSHHTETRKLHQSLEDVVVTSLPDAMKRKLGPFCSLFLKCTAWGVRPSFQEILEHMDDLAFFDSYEIGFFPIKPREETPFASPEIRKRKEGYETPKNRKRSRQQVSEGKTSASESVHWLKARSVMPAGHSGFTPVRQATGPKKSVRASKRSLHILNQIQRTASGKGRQES